MAAAAVVACDGGAGPDLQAPCRRELRGVPEAAAAVAAGRSDVGGASLGVFLTVLATFLRRTCGSGAVLYTVGEAWVKLSKRLGDGTRGRE